MLIRDPEIMERIRRTCKHGSTGSDGGLDTEDIKKILMKHGVDPKSRRAGTVGQLCTLYELDVESAPAVSQLKQDLERAKTPGTAIHQALGRIESMPGFYLDESAKRLLEAGYVPVESVSTSDRIFYISDTVIVDEMQTAVVYTYNLGIFFARCVYRSRSDGEWRASPGYIGKHISKGAGYHYTQETKLALPLYFRLQSRGTRGKRELTSEEGKYFRDQLSVRNKTVFVFFKDAFSSEVSKLSFPELEPTTLHRPGACFARCSSVEKIVDDVNENVYSLDFLPNFERPVFYYKTNHSLLSKERPDGSFEDDILVVVYGLTYKGVDLLWHIAQSTTRQEAVWISRISVLDNSTTTFGTDASVFDSGFLTNKPIEYRDQAGCLELGKHARAINYDYILITPVLSSLLPIQIFNKRTVGLPTRLSE
jgi:hypothetical protein